MSVALEMVLVAQGVSMLLFPPGTVVTSRADCVSKCYLTSSCSSIFYDNSTNLCHLVDNVYFYTDLVAGSDNIQYLAWTTDSCGDGYTWYRALNLCFKRYTTPSTWNAANITCDEDGGMLIKVDTEGTNTLMNQFADSSGKTCGNFSINGPEAAEGEHKSL